MELKSRGRECLANHFRRHMNNHTDLQPNRRLRDRMSGGVRGRGLATLSYSICNLKYFSENIVIYFFEYFIFQHFSTLYCDKI